MALAAILFGSGVSLSRFYEAGRGSYAAIVERMTSNGAAAYASNKEFRTGKVVDFFAAREGRERVSCRPPTGAANGRTG